MPDDHSKLVPLLPIPNRTVKRLSADDSADSRVKVGHRQALTGENARLIFDLPGFSIAKQEFLFLFLPMCEAMKSKKSLIYLTRLKKPVYNSRLS